MLVAPAIWKANLLAVLVADWVLTKVKGMAGEAEAKLAIIVVVAKDTVEEAWRLPETWRELAIVDDAEDTKPPYKLDRFATSKVEEALRTPLTDKFEEKVDEAMESNPLLSVNNPLPVSVFSAALLETTNWEVEALPDIAKEVVVASLILI